MSWVVTYCTQLARKDNVKIKERFRREADEINRNVASKDGKVEEKVYNLAVEVEDIEEHVESPSTVLKVANSLPKSYRSSP